MKSQREIMKNNPWKRHKKANMSLPKRINREVRKIAKTFGVADRVDTMAKQEGFVTLKYHKPCKHTTWIPRFNVESTWCICREEDYRTNPKYRLLNPTKKQLGKISKQILQKINKTLRSKLNINQWQNSSEFIDWLKNIKQKRSHTSTVFDIQEFYPSVAEKLLKDDLAFAQRYVEIKQNELDLFFHTRKSLLYCKDKSWIKKEGNGEFDVRMGSNNGAETCELVGLLLLYSIGEKLKKR